MTKEELKEYMKAYRQAHKEQSKAANKAYYEAHKEELKEYMKAYNKAYYQAHKDYYKAYNQANKEQRKEQEKEYKRADVNANGETKESIRGKSRRILKQMNLHIDGYEIHHCFGYEDPSKFIYCSRVLHLKIHQYLRDNNIAADSDHWMAIRDLVNSTDEFMYIKA